MSRGHLFILLALAVGLVAGSLLGGSGVSDPADLIGVSPAHASNGVQILDRSTFLSADGANAYVWRWDGERVTLVGQCSRIDVESTEQAPFVWMPGVEKGS